MKKKKQKEEKPVVEAIWITCRFCGTERIEEKAWVIEDLKTECPVCGTILEL